MLGPTECPGPPRPTPSGAPERTGERTFHWSFPASTAAVAQARNAAADAVGQRYPELTEDVRLVVSELATNAVRHAGSAFRVHAVLGPRGVRMEVEDASESPPVVRQPTPDAPSGRGFHLIAAVCRRWGVRIDDGGKAVWVELSPRPPNEPAPGPAPGPGPELNAAPP